MCVSNVSSSFESKTSNYTFFSKTQRTIFYFLCGHGNFKHVTFHNSIVLKIRLIPSFCNIVQDKARDNDPNLRKRFNLLKHSFAFIK